MPKYVVPNLRGPKLVWVPSKSGWMYVGTMALEAWFNWSHIVHHMLSQVMKLRAHPNPMSSENWVKSKCYNIQVQHSYCGWFIYIFDGLQRYELKLDNWMIMNYLGTSLVDHFIWVHMSWLNWINMQCCLLQDDWMDKCIVIKFGLICVG